MSTLTVIRDAKKEIKQSIKDFENSECITHVDPWKYDYSKLEALQQKEGKNDNDDDDVKENDAELLEEEDDYDLLCFGMNEVELTELQSLRVYQIYECIQFVDEVIHHIYLFVIKHFKENVTDSHAQNQWLTKLVEAIGVLPNYVDELSCCIYSPQPLDEVVCKNASNLLHFIWMVSIEVAEECVQFKDRKMVIKNRKQKTKTSLTGYEWKCKFIDLNIQIGKMFGLVSMEHIEEYIEKDEKYKKQMGKKQKKKKKHNGKKKKKKKQKKKKEVIDNDFSASSNKEPESTNPTDTTVQSNDNDQVESSADMIDID